MHEYYRGTNPEFCWIIVEELYSWCNSVWLFKQIKTTSTTTATHIGGKPQIVEIDFFSKENRKGVYRFWCHCVLDSATLLYYSVGASSYRIEKIQRGRTHYFHTQKPRISNDWTVPIEPVEIIIN